ncbi:MAG TPA: hypothetical protein VG297_12710 [Bryobacteraceae bacterium]|jgi:hypothetical protein|nr:hypothetical protein [Bryobacteraceae bacterium]
MLLAAAFVGLWFAAAFALSVTGWFRQFTSAELFGIGALASATGFLVLHALSEQFRGFLRACRLRRLTQAQILRLFGNLALLKASQHVLPAIFAIPTALIDDAFALSSFYVASHLIGRGGDARRGFIAWNVAGLGGLVFSVAAAVLTSSAGVGFAKDGITSWPMTWFPMSLVPTFIGPLVLICHLLALAAVLHARRK